METHIRKHGRAADRRTSAPTERERRRRTIAEYIERGTAIAKLTALEVSKPNATIVGAKRLLAEIPAADVVPVVRCKDCKHFKHYGKTSLLIDGEHIKAGWCYRRVRYNEEYRMPPDGFCSYGERKDDADG